MKKYTALHFFMYFCFLTLLLGCNSEPNTENQILKNEVSQEMVYPPSPGTPYHELHQRDLTKHWNLVSFPVTRETNLQTFLSELATASGIQSIWKWKHTDGTNGTWQVYPQTGEFELLESIFPDAGYWIRARENFSLTGEGVSSNVYNFIEGWNLVGYTHSGSTMTFSDFFSQGDFWKDTCETSEAVISVWAWEKSTWKLYFPDDADRVAFNTEHGTSFEALTNVEPGMGFWVNAKQNNNPPSTGVCTDSKIRFKVATGNNHSCVILNDSTIECWGEGDSGQLGNGSTSKQKIPVSVSEITTATQVTAGGQHTCSLLSDGSVRCWGKGNVGQLGNGDTTDQNTPVTVSGISTASQVSAGGGHTCAVLSDSSVQCWGNGYTGQLGNGVVYGYQEGETAPVSVSDISTAVQVSVGGNHSCALLNDNTIQCWGAGSSGNLGNGSDADQNTPVLVNGITTAVQITSGYNHTCALLQDGSVQCWGWGEVGQLGNGELSNQSTPVAVVGITTAVQVTAGDRHSCAVLQDSSIQCWGFGLSGELGNGGTTTQTTPVTVSNIDTALQVSAGGEHTCSLLSNDSVKCWGKGDSGQLGNSLNYMVDTSFEDLDISNPLVITPLSFTGEVYEIGRTPSESLISWEVDGNARTGNVALNAIPNGNTLVSGNGVLSSALLNPVLDVSSYSTVSLSFWYNSTSNPRISSVHNCDSSLNIYSKIDSGDWVHKTSQCGEHKTESTGWRFISLDFDVTDKSTLQFAFEYYLQGNTEVDSSVYFLIDDLEITAQ